MRWVCFFPLNLMLFQSFQWTWFRKKITFISEIVQIWMFNSLLHRIHLFGRIDILCYQLVKSRFRVHLTEITTEFVFPHNKLLFTQINSANTPHSRRTVRYCILFSIVHWIPMHSYCDSTNDVAEYFVYMNENQHCICGLSWSYKHMYATANVENRYDSIAMVFVFVCNWIRYLCVSVMCCVVSHRCVCSIWIFLSIFHIHRVFSFSVFRECRLFHTLPNSIWLPDSISLEHIFRRALIFSLSFVFIQFKLFHSFVPYEMGSVWCVPCVC